MLDDGAFAHSSDAFDSVLACKFDRGAEQSCQSFNWTWRANAWRGKKAVWWRRGVAARRGLLKGFFPPAMYTRCRWCLVDLQLKEFCNMALSQYQIRYAQKFIIFSTYVYSHPASGPQTSSLQQNSTPSSSVSLILGNSSAATYCLRTPSNLLLLLAKAGSTGKFPLFARAEGAEDAESEGARAEDAEDTESEGARAEDAEDGGAEPESEGARAEDAMSEGARADGSACCSRGVSLEYLSRVRRG